MLPTTPKIKTTLNTLVALSVLLCFSPTVFSSMSVSSAELLQSAHSLRSSQPEQASAILEQISQEQLNKAEQDEFDYIDAYLKFMRGDVQQAIIDFENLAETGNTIEGKFNAYASLGSLYAGTQNWSAGLKTIEYLTDKVGEIDAPEIQEQAHLAVINLYSQMNEVNALIQYVSPLLDKGFSPRFQCFANMQMIAAKIDNDVGVLDEKAVFDAMKICKNANEPLAHLNLYNQLASLLYKEGKREKALEILLEHFDSISNTNYKPLKDDFYMLLSQSYFALGEFERAERFANLIVGNKAPTDLISKADVIAYEILYKIAESKQQFEQALILHKRYAQAKSRNINSENAKMLAVQKAKQDSAEKLNQIALLDAENSLLRAEAELDQETAHNRLLLIGFMLMALMFIMIWLYKKHTTYLKLQEVSRKDGLTDIANRHFFTTHAEKTVQRCEHEGVVLSLVIFDLDNFKQINDTFGHAAGDIALQTAVDATKTACRGNDVIGRLGGEEFAILMESCSLEKALEIAEACRAAIEKTNESEQAYELKASFGVSCSDTYGYRFDALFDAADKGLYLAKHKGKNRVEHLSA